MVRSVREEVDVVQHSKVVTPGDSIARNRWFVHPLLIVGFLVALISAAFLSRRYLGHSGTGDYAFWGPMVLALVVVHLVRVAGRGDRCWPACCAEAARRGAGRGWASRTHDLPASPGSLRPSEVARDGFARAGRVRGPTRQRIRSSHVR